MMPQWLRPASCQGLKPGLSRVGSQPSLTQQLIRLVLRQYVAGGLLTTDSGPWPRSRHLPWSVVAGTQTDWRAKVNGFVRSHTGVCGLSSPRSSMLLATKTVLEVSQDGVSEKADVG